MNSRLRPVLNGLGSILLLGLLLLGPPLALAKLVGWPLPTSIPSLDTVDLALRSGISDDAVAKGLALVGWVAWFQVALAIAVEVIAVIRRRPARSVPVLPGFQATAGRLVASVAMMLATSSPAAVGASAPPTSVMTFAASAQVEVPVETPVPAPSNVSVASERATPAPAPPAGPPTVTVEKHDSFWAIAERTVGDGYRWREIRDLNVGRTMNTGDVIQAGSDLVQPGWVLDLPGDAQGAAVGSAPGELAHDVPTEVVVEPGDNLWELAEEQLAVATGEQPTDAETLPYWHDLIGANEDRFVQPGNPSLIVPGQHLTAPPVPGAADTTGGPAKDPTGPTNGPTAPDPAAPVPTPAEETEASQGASNPTTVESSVPPAPSTDVEPAPTTVSREKAPPVPGDQAAERQVVEQAEDGSELPVGTIALGIASAALAAGATRAIRRRRLRAAHRSPNAPPSLDDEATQAVHRELIIDGDEADVDNLRAVLGSLARTLASTGATARPRVVQHAPDHLDLVMTARCATPAGWNHVGDETLWTAEFPRLLGDDPAICAAPLLVTLGQPDDGGQIYLDLEAERQVALVGDHETARAVARAMLLELALTPLADSLEVLVIGGLAPPEVARLDHVTLASSWDDVTDDLIAWTRQSHDAITGNDWPNAFIARGVDPHHDALAPIVAVAAEPPPPKLLAAMATSARSTLTIVMVGAIDDATVVDCQPECLRIVDLGLECIPHPIESEFLDAVIELVSDGEPIHIGDDAQLSLLPDMATVEPDSDEDSLADPDFEILVRVLGDIRIEGGEPVAAKQTAVVVYIALHETISIEKLEDAVWGSPTTTNRRKRLANTISECRSALGRHLFPPASDGRYRAGPGIVTDLELFDRRIRRAADQTPGDAADTLLTALELVTGGPFTYRSADRRSFAWVEVENWASTWELKIAAVAQRCSDLLLDLGRCEEAIEASMRALAAMPTHTGVTEALMRAHAANGDRLAVRRVYEEHLTALRSLDLDEADESTTDLYAKLVTA